MQYWVSILIVAVAALIAAGILSVRIVEQYQRGVVFRLGRVVGLREPGLRFVIPFVDVLRRVSLRVVMMPIHSRRIVTRDGVHLDVDAVACFRIVDASTSIVAVENLDAAIDHVAQTTLLKVINKHTLEEALSDTGTINGGVRDALAASTVDWGVEITLVELEDIQVLDTLRPTDGTHWSANPLADLAIP